MPRQITYRLRFGIRGGIISEQYFIKSKKMAESLAMDICNILEASAEKDWNGVNPPRTMSATWKMHSNCTMKAWTSSVHFVSLEILKG